MKLENRSSIVFMKILYMGFRGFYNPLSAGKGLAFYRGDGWTPKSFRWYDIDKRDVTGHDVTQRNIKEDI